MELRHKSWCFLHCFLYLWPWASRFVSTRKRPEGVKRRFGNKTTVIAHSLDNWRNIYLTGKEFRVKICVGQALKTSLTASRTSMSWDNVRHHQYCSLSEICQMRMSTAIWNLTVTNSSEYLMSRRPLHKQMGINASHFAASEFIHTVGYKISYFFRSWLERLFGYISNQHWRSRNGADYSCQKMLGPVWFQYHRYIIWIIGPAWRRGQTVAKASLNVSTLPLWINAAHDALPLFSYLSLTDMPHTWLECGDPSGTSRSPSNSPSTHDNLLSLKHPLSYIFVIIERNSKSK